MTRRVLVLLLLLASIGVAAATEPALRVLVYSETSGFRHASIPAGVALVERLGRRHGFAVTASEDAASFLFLEEDEIDVVVWLNTTGDVLDGEQQAAFEDFIRGGGGYVGVHAAADTEYDWAWYGGLLGGDAWFSSHPPVQPARVVREDGLHPSTAHLAEDDSFVDEWYAFRENPRPFVSVLLSVDETSYDPGADPMGDHPIAWSHAFDGGRSWYTNLGHRIATYDDPRFERHLAGGILWAAGCDADCFSTAQPCPGDCDGNGSVRIAELVRLVAIAVGRAPLGDCAAGDADRSGTIEIAELVGAVGASLRGCDAADLGLMGRIYSLSHPESVDCRRRLRHRNRNRHRNRP